jgi:hypothetical protein
VLGRARRLTRDVRALGASAPLRGGYEASKRLGGHAVVFGVLGKVRARRGFAPPLALPAASTVPDLAVKRAVEAAEEIASGRVVLFGRTIEVGQTPRWHDVIEREGAWADDAWWKIDIRSEARIGDVKWAWELGRARHLVVLARGAASPSAPEAVRDALERHVRSWLDQNPPERGVHWYSNLELALRSIAWSEILTLSREVLPADVVSSLEAHLGRCLRHLLADLPYTLSTMRNNHLLGDALGITVLERGLRRPGGLASPSAAVAARMFGAQADRHFHDDGSMIEDSLSYHRFVLEMLVVERLLDPTGPPRPALARSAQLLARLGALDGPVPEYGDWDEGRVLVSSQDPQDLSGTVRCALALAGSGATAEWRADHDECAWYAPEGTPVAPDEPERDGHDIGGGIARAERGPLVAWLKAGSGPSHGHADLLSTSVLCDGAWVLGDPGTGTYNGPLEQRDHFRTSVAHNVVRIDGTDQLGPHRAFRWLRSARGVVGPPLRADGWLVMWGAHDAYTFLDPPRRVVRAVALREDAVVVADWVEGPATHLALSLPLGPACAWDAGTSTIQVRGTTLALRVPVVPAAVRGQETPFDGWWSTTYGQFEPSSRLELEVSGGPVWWSLGMDAAPDVAIEGLQMVIAGATTLAPTWLDRSCRLQVGAESATVDL